MKNIQDVAKCGAYNHLSEREHWHIFMLYKIREDLKRLSSIKTGEGYWRNRIGAITFALKYIRKEKDGSINHKAYLYDVIMEVFREEGIDVSGVHVPTFFRQMSRSFKDKESE